MTHGFFEIMFMEFNKKSGLVAPVSRSEFDERLADSYEILDLMHYESYLWSYDNGYDGSGMSHIDRKRDYESFSRPKWNLVYSDFLSKIIINYKLFKLEIHGRSTNRRIGPIF